MPNLTKRGFKKPLETEAYDININNFNTDKTEEELDKLLSKDGDGKDVKVTFAESETDSELTSQSKLSTLFGTIKKKFNMFSQNLEHKADLVDGKVSNEQLSIVNDLTTGGEDKVASAETVKSLNNDKADKNTIIITDANLAIKNGKYAITASGGLNVPILNQTFIIDVSQRADTYLVQRAKCYSLAPYNTYERCCFNGVWNNWVKCTTEQDLIANDLIKAKSSISLYVANTGSDTTGDGTSAKPFATIQKALDSIPKNLGGYTVTINVSAGIYDGFICQQFCNGIIKILGGTDSDTANNFVITGNVLNYFNSAHIYICGFKINTIFSVYNSKGTVDYLVFPTYSEYAFSISGISQFNIVRNNITSRPTAIYVSEESMLSVWGSTISGGTLGINAGVNSGTSCIITVNSCSITSVTKYAAVYGSVIIEDGVPISSTPKNHAESTGIYGTGNATNYGHVRVIDNLTQTVYTAEALSARQGNILQTTKAPNHQSGTTAPSAFVGEGVLYGVHS